MTDMKSPKSGDLGWKGWEDILRTLPGPLVEVYQKSKSDPIVPKSKQKKSSLIVFLGGCTYTEIAAIRFLSQCHETRDFTILTTHITNGNEIMKSMEETSLLT